VEKAAHSKSSENRFYETHNLKVIGSNPIPATSSTCEAPVPANLAGYLAGALLARPPAASSHGDL
jgi:hypothetical protein